MVKKLQNYFPMIRTRKEVLKEINQRKELKILFETWREEQQEEFLDFCTGARGIKILYDSFFKEIFSPEYHPERIERFLSLILQKNVKISQILPNDSVRIADESSLLITDIVVELEDGSLANVEIQKIGYAFPGERIACYSADLLLRQYKRIRAKRKKKFTYRDIKTVYTIVLFEKSTKEFHDANESYIHRGRQRFDTELKLNILQEYILIPLDIFKENTHNKSIQKAAVAQDFGAGVMQQDINSELEAWLSFISFDEPEKMIELIDAYPEFKIMYDELYQLCSNTERVMGMFSKELLELDRNTVQYMIEEQEKELEELRKETEKRKIQLQETKTELYEKDVELQKKNARLQEREAKLQERDARLQAVEFENEELRRRLEQLEAKVRMPGKFE